MLFSPCWTQYLDVFKPTVWLDAFCTADMEITAECLNSHFITPFLLTCICCGDWFFFFSALCPFFFFPGPPSSAFISQAAWGGWAGSRAVSGSTDVVSVEPVRLRPVGALSRGHIYRKRASEWAKAPGWSCYIPPLNTIRLSVCKSDCLSSPRRSVLSHFYYLLSHTPCLPLPAFHCLSLPSWRIVSLYLALL